MNLSHTSRKIGTHPTIMVHEMDIDYLIVDEMVNIKIV
jgi:hypothetical protein